MTKIAAMARRRGWITACAGKAMDDGVGGSFGSGGDGGGLVVYGAGVRVLGQRTAGVHNEFVLTFPPLIGSRGDCCETRRWVVAAVQARHRSGMNLLHPRPDVL